MLSLELAIGGGANLQSAKQVKAVGPFILPITLKRLTAACRLPR